MGGEIRTGKAELGKTVIVTPELGFKLEDLFIKPGDLAAFDNSDLDRPQPFILGRAGKETLSKNPGRHINEKIKLMWSPSRSILDLEAFYFHVPEGIIELWSPKNFGGLRIPDIRHHSAEDYRNRIIYVVESAYAGVETIVHALNCREDLGFDLYANWLKSESERIGK